MRKHWKKIVLIIALLILIILAVAACSSGLGRSEDPSETTLPTAETTVPAAETTAPIEDTTAPTEESTAPAEDATTPTEPEETDPPVTEAPATEPPVTEAPVMQAPPQQPDYTSPPATEPSVAEPPATEPPATEPPTTQPPESEHEHNYYKSVWVTPTCTVDGYNTYVCADCGHSYTEMLSATGHNWGEPSVTKQPTVDSEGVETVQCRDCSFIEDRTLDKLPPPDPAQCTHEWTLTDFQNEEGHYGNGYCRCKCGARFETPEEWGVHIESFDPLTALNEHTSWSGGQDWIVDTPGWQRWVCVHCGEALVTEPCIYPGME